MKKELLALSLIFSSMNCFAKESIQWVLLTGFKPVFILDGKFKGEGFYDYLTAYLQKKLPEYEHSNVEAIDSRIIQNMKEGKNLCYVSGVKIPERENLMYFSMPNTFATANSVVMKQKTAAAKLGGAQEVDLKALLERKDLKGLVIQSRTYDANIDQIIAPYRTEDPKKRKGHLQIYNANLGEGPMKMLLRDRIDYTIEFEWLAQFLLEESGDATPENKLASLKVKGTDPFIFGRVACTKNAWGKAIIDKVNKILSVARTEKEYQEKAARWMLDKEQFHKDWQNVLLKMND